MNQAECYHLLGLKVGASLAEIKSSYRRLARQYHPDVNSDDRAGEKFIAITEAYQYLLDVAQMTPTQAGTHIREKESVTVRTVTRSSPPGKLSEVEKQLKSQSYQQLQTFLKDQRFARAVTLVEGLAQRLPHDVEVKQWQAIAYQRWGRYLVSAGQHEKARIYLKKALRTDPHNRALWAEVDRDFRRMEDYL